MTCDVTRYNTICDVSDRTSEAGSQQLNLNVRAQPLKSSELSLLCVVTKERHVCERSDRTLASQYLDTRTLLDRNTHVEYICPDETEREYNIDDGHARTTWEISTVQQ